VKEAGSAKKLLEYEVRRGVKKKQGYLGEGEKPVWCGGRATQMTADYFGNIAVFLLGVNRATDSEDGSC